MRVTVCELSHEEDDFQENWDQLIQHVRSEQSDLVLLPEMPFSPWFAASPAFDPEVWAAAVSAHDQWIDRLSELAPVSVLGSRPVRREDARLNEAFAWEVESGYHPAHHKYYLPDEEGFWEASWYQRGDGSFRPVDVGEATVGFAICTDIWFFHRARAYGQAGAHLLAHPRATLRINLDKWLAAGRAAAVVSGAFCISSNHVCPRHSKPDLGGMGWIVGPDGEVLGLTSREEPFVTREIDLMDAVDAKATYPRYVAD